MFRLTSSKTLTLVVLLALAAAVGGVTYLYYNSHSSRVLYQRGVQALERGDLTGADRFTSAVEQKGDAGRAHLLRGKNWLAAALAVLKRAKPPPPYEQAQEAGQLVLAGAPLGWQPTVLRAEAWLFTALIQNPQPAPSPGRKELRRALAEFAQVRDAGALGLEASLLAAKCLTQLNQKQLAADGLNDLLARHPNEAQAHRLLASIYMDLNSPGNAISHLRDWARLDPDNGVPYRWIGFFEKDSSAAGEAAAAAYREALQRELGPAMRARVLEELAAVLMAQQGKFQEALDLLDQSPDPFRDSTTALTLRTECLTNLGKTREAAQVLDHLLDLHPNSPHALWLRAKAYLDEKRTAEALHLLEQAVRLDPRDYQIQDALAAAYEQAGDKVKAQQHRQAAEETLRIKERLGALYREAAQQPWNDSIRYEMGVLCVQINRLQDARTWLRAALASNPDNLRARHLLAQVGRASPRERPAEAAP